MHLEFNFEAAEAERPIMEHWRRLESAAREELSEENLCLAWVTGSDGRAWVDWWKQLPNYKREMMLSSFRFERRRMDDLMEAWQRNHPDLPRPYMKMAPYTEPSREEISQEQAIVDSMVREIKAAAIDRRPLPLSESENMSPLDRATFRSRLAAAFNLAGVVLIAAEHKAGGLS